MELPPVGKAASEVKEHGLFVAGLAHAVAPASQISLVQVLDEGAQGELATLVYSLNWYVMAHAGQGVNSANTLDRTIVNLSLGFVPDPNDTFPHASEVIFHNVRNLGAVVVAAAGNHSAGITPPLDPELPAAWEDVIGVGASNQAGAGSCYANHSDDVYAPGGDGDTAAPSGCEPSWAVCSPDDPECGFGVISLVSNGLTPPDVEYAFWSGSSFATPLVSGLSALFREAGTPPADVPTRVGASASGTVPVINVGSASP
jgi:subtilisin family serine protease